MPWFIYSCCGTLFFLLRLLQVLRLLHFTPAPLAAGAVTPLTSFSPPYGCQEWKKTPEEIWFNPVFSRKKTRTNSWIWNQSKTRSVHGSDVSDSGYDLILAQVFSECWRLRVVRNPEPAAYSGGFSDTVFTRHEEVGALQQTAPYTALSIISHSIHENRSTAGSTVWTAKL